MRACVVFWVAFICGFAVPAGAQAWQPHFRHVGVEQGLNDGVVSALAQDKYGYIWMATLGGLNRFNGTRIQRFTHRHADSTSAPNGNAYCMIADRDGRLWIGYDFGLYEFELETNRFVAHRSFDNIYVKRMVAGPDHRLYLITSAGFFAYHTQTKQRSAKDLSDSTLSKHRCLSMAAFGNTLYIGSDNGFLTLNFNTRHTQFVPVSGYKSFVTNRIGVDGTGAVWLSDINQALLLRYRPDTQTSECISDRPLLQSMVRKMSFNDFACDNDGNMWIASSNSSPLRYDIKSQQLHLAFDEETQGMARADSYVGTIMKSSDGNLWFSGQNGASYFNPDQRIFSTLLPLPGKTRSPIARAMVEDKQGNLWFSSTEGISRYHQATGTYTTFTNEPGKPNSIYSNTVRGITVDDEGTIWAATGSGVNSCLPGAAQLRFHTTEEGIPTGFYFGANRDNSGRVWFGTRDNDGLYYYSAADHRFHSIRQHPLLKRFAGYGVRIVFQDSRKRLWIGFNGSGLAMADEQNNQVRYWFNNDKTRQTIIGNMVVDIKEDRKGVIWVSTFNGVTGINTQQDTYTWLDGQSFFNTNFTGPLLIDAKDRLWIGTAMGLYVADSNRRIIGSFFKSDGLPANGFNEHSGYTLTNGMAMMPTMQGFTRFDPLRFEPAPAMYGFYIAGMEVNGKTLHVPRAATSVARLKHYENNLTIALETINYNAATTPRFAYRLDGLEKEWHYTQDGRVVYTNLPGGKYVFRYKTDGHAAGGPVAEKTLAIFVATVYHETIWFRALVVALGLAILLAWFRYRIQHQKQVLQLQAKAQQLEKEKVMVMYENLIQHLNPHFLFNSLTSLSSLIRVDQQMAGEFLERMSKIYRYILKNRDSETVALRDELDFVAQYIELQKTRFGDGLQVHMHVDDEDMYKRLAPVTLQNLVENAIKHNLISKNRPLHIYLEVQNDYLVVRNNLQRKNFVETSNKQGLQSMQSLYGFLSPRPMLVQEDGQYFSVHVPLI